MGIELARVHVAVRGDTAALRHDMRSARKIVDDSLHRTRSMGISASTALRDTYGGMVAVLAPVAAILDKMVFSAVKLASNFEMTKIAFETMMGSAPAAAAMLKSLSDFAKKTPFQIEDVEQGARQLMAVGFAANEVLPTLKSIGDVSAGIGRGQDGLQRLILNMGQVKAQTRLTGRELRDFAVLGVPLIGELATIFGKTTGEIKELVEAGAITSDHVVLAFERMTSAGGKFADLTAKQSNTVLGLWSNLVDTVTVKLRELGEGINKAFNLKDIIKTMMEFVERITPAMAETIAWTAGFVTLAAAITGALFTMQALHIMMGVTFLGGGIGIAIIALSAALGMWIVKNREAVVEFLKTNKAVLAIKNGVVKMTKVFSQAWESLVDVFQKIKRPLMIVLEGVAMMIVSVGGINLWWSALLKWIPALTAIAVKIILVSSKFVFFGLVAQGVFKLINFLVNEFLGGWKKLADSIMEFMKPAFDFIEEGFKTIKDALDVFSANWGLTWEFIKTHANTAWLEIELGARIMFTALKALWSGYKVFVEELLNGVKTSAKNVFLDLRDAQVVKNTGEMIQHVRGNPVLDEKQKKEAIKRLEKAQDEANARIVARNPINEEGLIGVIKRADRLATAEEARMMATMRLQGLNEKINASKQKEAELMDRMAAAAVAKNKAAEVEVALAEKIKTISEGIAKGKEVAGFLFDKAKLGLAAARARESLGGDTSPGSLLKDTGGRVGFAELGTKIQDALLPKKDDQLEAVKEGNADRKKLLEFVSKLSPLTLFTLK